MRDSEKHWNSVSRRGALTAAGAAAVTAATGAALAQSAEDGAPTSQEKQNGPAAKNSLELTHKRAKTNGVTLHYVTAGQGPTVLCMHGWPQNHREFLPVIERLADRFAFIAPDLRDTPTAISLMMDTNRKPSPKTCSAC